MTKILQLQLLVLLLALLVATVVLASEATFADALGDQFERQQPTWYSPKQTPPETSEERVSRVRMAARVLAEAAAGSAWPERFQRVAVLAAASVWINESGLDWAVHAGKPSPVGPSDYGKAKCMGQIHTWPGNTLLTKEQWAALPGTDEAATRRCADATLAYLFEHARKCLRVTEERTSPLSDAEVVRLFAAYGDGHCSPVDASDKKRLDTYRRLRGSVLRELGRLDREVAAL